MNERRDLRRFAGAAVPVDGGLALERTGRPSSPPKSPARARPAGSGHFSTRLALLALAAIGSSLLVGCAAVHDGEPGAAGYRPPSTVSTEVTLAPPQLDPLVEIHYLARPTTNAARLRRAWLELQVRRADEALADAGEVLYGASPPAPNEEAFARFLRSEAFRQKGVPERGAFDRERALALAVDPSLRVRLTDAAPRPAAATESIGALRITPRDDWHAQDPDPRSLVPMTAPNRLTIHHSAIYLRDTRPSASATQIQRIQREHMQQRGYGDIGYHFLIDPSGRIWQGRELRWQGAHASGDNNIGNIGICLLGNFVQQRAGQGPTALQVASMQELVMQLMHRYRIAPDGLHCHSDFKPTECPGPRMRPLVLQFVRELRLRGGHAASAED